MARQGLARIAVVGGGAGGVELMLSVESRLRREVAQAGFDQNGLSFVLITHTPDILPTFPPAIRMRFRVIFYTRHISIVTGAAVTQIEAGRLLFDGAPPVEADEVLWTTQAAPASWLAETADCR